MSSAATHRTALHDHLITDAFPPPRPTIPPTATAAEALRIELDWLHRLRGDWNGLQHLADVLDDDYGVDGADDTLILIHNAAAEAIEELWLLGQHEQADTAARDWQLPEPAVC
jgi:hypothetical protein